MTYILGLTGSIGMGKSTTARMFRDLSVPVWDADATVHTLYGPGGAALKSIATLVPGSVTSDGVDRSRLKEAIAENPSILKKIEAIVHPLVAENRKSFLEKHKDHALVVLDIPLLFETGGDAACDGVLVVTTDAEEQKRRVLSRGTDETTFQDLLSRQMPDAEKQERASFVIRTDTLAGTAKEVETLVAKLKSQNNNRRTDA